MKYIIATHLIGVIISLLFIGNSSYIEKERAKLIKKHKPFAAYFGYITTCFMWELPVVACVIFFIMSLFRPSKSE